MSRDKNITTRHYDLCDHPIGRAIRQDVRFRYLPFGHFAGGPNLFFWLQAALLHRLGGCALRISYALESSRLFRACWRLDKRLGSRPASRKG